jgi:hypothetical protein
MGHTLVDRDGAAVLTASSPFFFDGIKPAISTRWPELGEDGDDVVRRWLGTGAAGVGGPADRPAAPISP